MFLKLNIVGKNKKIHIKYALAIQTYCKCGWVCWYSGLSCLRCLSLFVSLGSAVGLSLFSARSDQLAVSGSHSGVWLMPCSSTAHLSDSFLPPAV